jgi:hypothetical protein
MKALGANARDFVLVDVFVTLLENDERWAVSALDELVERRLIVCCMSLSYHRPHLGHLSAGQISRTRFERLLELRLDKVRVRTARNASGLSVGHREQSSTTCTGGMSNDYPPTDSRRC